MAAKCKPVKKKSVGATGSRPQAKGRKNPAAVAERAAADRLTPAARKALDLARRMARTFHGGGGHVVELSAKERRPLPRFVVVAGSLSEAVYDVYDGLRRGRWRHESGDRGDGKPKSKNLPLLAVDPITRRPVIVPNRSPMKMDPRKGFVG